MEFLLFRCFAMSVLYLWSIKCNLHFVLSCWMHLHSWKEWKTYEVGLILPISSYNCKNMRDKVLVLNGWFCWICSSIVIVDYLWTSSSLWSAYLQESSYTFCLYIERLIGQLPPQKPFYLPDSVDSRHVEGIYLRKQRRKSIERQDFVGGGRLAVKWRLCVERERRNSLEEPLCWG